MHFGIIAVVTGLVYRCSWLFAIRTHCWFMFKLLSGSKGFFLQSSFLACWHPACIYNKVIPCWVQDFVHVFIELEIFNMPAFLAIGCPLDWPPRAIPGYCFRVLSACSSPSWVSPATLLSVHLVPSPRFSVKTLTSISCSSDLWRTPLVNVCQLDFVLLIKTHRA